MEVKVKISVSEKDYINFTFYHQRQPMIWVPFIVFALLVLLCAGGDMMHGRKDNVVLICVIAMVSAVLVFLFGSLVAFFRAKRVWQSSTLLKTAGLVEATFSDAGLREESEASTLNLGYGNILKICETKTAFYLFVSTIQAAIIPKRCFDSTNDIQAVRELFRKNMDKKKLRLIKS